MQDLKKVSGSYGVITIDEDTGNVIKYTPYHHDDDLYRSITAFNVEEFKSVYGDALPDSIDILDIGCWEGAEYCPPSQNFRNKRSKQGKSDEC